MKVFLLLCALVVFACAELNLQELLKTRNEVRYQKSREMNDGGEGGEGGEGSEGGEGGLDDECFLGAYDLGCIAHVVDGQDVCFYSDSTGCTCTCQSANGVMFCQEAPPTCMTFSSCVNWDGTPQGCPNANVPAGANAKICDGPIPCTGGEEENK